MKNNQFIANLIPFGIIITVFIIDLFTPLGYAIGVIYVFALFITALQNKNKLVMVTTFLAASLIAIVYFITGGQVVYNDVMFNRIVAIVIVVCSGILIRNKEKWLKVTFAEVDGLDIQALKVMEETEDYAIILLSSKGIITNWNNGAERMFNFSKEDIINKHVSNLSSSEDEEKDRFTLLVRNLQKGNESKTKLWLKRKSGSLFWSEIRLKAIFNEKQKNIGISLIVHDIDSKRSLEQLLTATNSLAKVGGWEYDLQTDRLFWSETTKEIHEVEADYVPNTTEGIKFYLEGKDRDRIAEVFGKMIETGIAFEEELRIITAKNNIRWVRSKAYPIMVEGVCKKIYGSFQDIDDLKRKELDLIKSEKRFKNMFRYSANGMARIDVNGRFLETNKSYHELVGYNSEELEKLKVVDLTHKEDIPRDKELFARLEDGEIESFITDKRLFHKSGKMKWANVTVSRITNDDNFTDYFLAQLTDITERKDSEIKLIEQQNELIEKNKELNQYAYITSHDLQEPVRTISSFSDLLNQQYADTIDDTGKKYLRFINEASLRLKDQIKGLLDYSRLGKKDKVPNLTDVNNVVKNVIQDLNTLITEKNATINSENLPSIHIYETEFMLLIQNLISNAIKFQKEDTLPLINLSAEEKDHEWKFCVSDNGIGMEERFFSKVFLIFQRLHGRKEYEGSGIGLAHCKKIIELHKGKIWVESKLGEGSQFYFTINKGL